MSGTQSLIGVKMKERRKSMRLTQAALAKQVGVSVSYLNLIENGKRTVNGALLKRIAASLELDLNVFEHTEERRLMASLKEITADPILRGSDVGEAPPDTRDIADFVGRHPDWARVVIALHRAFRDRDRVAAALSDRLGHDPFLSDGVHRMLSHVSAIRATSEILASVENEGGALENAEIPPERMARFHKALASDSQALSDVSRALADFFDKTETTGGDATPDEKVEIFFNKRNNYFEALEQEAQRIRDEIGLDAPAARRSPSGEVERLLSERLEQSADIRCFWAAEPAEGDSGASRLRLDTRRLEFFDHASGPTRRFEIARRIVEAELINTINDELDASPLLDDEFARLRARRALISYAAGALLFPYETFLERAEAARYDVDVLARRFGASYEQAAHRLATLRRPARSGVPFAFMRVDPSGFLTKRLTLPNLPLPRRGGACPLWVVYQAFQTPHAPARQIAEFPNGEKFVLMACAVAKDSPTFGRPRKMMSIMLGCEALYADKLVYADGAPPAEPVGATCALCVRRACAHRQEAALTPL